MNKRRAALDVIAARAVQNGFTGKHHSVMPPVAVGPVLGSTASRRAVKLTSTQRDSLGRKSDWSRSPYAPRGGWR